MRREGSLMRSLGGLFRDHYGDDAALFRERPFALLWAARTLSMMGSAFAPVALAFGVLALPGATASTLSVVLASEAIPLVLFMLVGGVIGDRFPRQRVMMTGELMNATAFAALGIMLLTGHAPVPALCAAAAITGIGMAVMYPALTGIVPEVVPADRLQSGNALLALGANTARIAGIAASGAAVVWIGGGWALVAAAGLFAAAALMIARLRMSSRVREAGGSVIGELKEGWDEFRSRQWLWVVVAQFSLLVMGLQAAHGVLGPVVAKTELGGAAAWSAVLVGEAVGMVVGVMVALRLRPQRPILFGTLLLFPAALPYLLLGASAPLWSVVLAMFGAGGLLRDLRCAVADHPAARGATRRAVPGERLRRPRIDHVRPHRPAAGRAAVGLVRGARHVDRLRRAGGADHAGVVDRPGGASAASARGSGPARRSGPGAVRNPDRSGGSVGARIPVT